MEFHEAQKKPPNHWWSHRSGEFFNQRGVKVAPFHSGDIVLTQAEFSLFFEGSDINKRFIESPPQIIKSSQQIAAN